ncbi:hypothetical protein HYW19_02935 [Candidatus Woesearchaeota archaeon]|nr:hypothetical protein [Candidatus Woesearchaeota archaeon]
MNQDKEPKKPTKTELFAELDELKSDVNFLKKEMNKTNGDKESWYSRKEEISRGIREKINAIKQNREKRDSLTGKVRELKEKRAKLNDELRKKVFELTGLKKQSADLMKKSKITYPSKIKTDIDSIESKLETEVMSFDKEKELSKKLKLLKKSLADASGLISVLDAIKKLNPDVGSAKKESNAVHKEIQDLAKESQALHETIISESKNVDELKAKEEGAFLKFVEFKKVFNEKNSMLKDNLKSMDKIRAEISKFQLEENEKRRLQEAMLIKNKERDIEDKIKSGKKLTTEDFLVFQESIKGTK